MNCLLNRPLRHLITRGDATDLNFSEKKKEIIDIVRRASTAGIEMVQMREKKLSASRMFDLARSAVEAVASGTKILINDRYDIAVAAGADGVHLTGLSLPTKIVRENVPDGFIVSRSTHSLDETIAERYSGADFVMFGPVFATPGKGIPAGLKQLSKVCDAAGEMPVIAIGGIDESNYESVLEIGASGYASIRYLNDFVMMKK